ncbi:hypothetical protein TUZN_0392 [Thermoproteus uzoniensis 768-20]|uniref:Uncharacterized protein n=1 Tax=Thermoproteus uzoniensis (strain 768-20) TaxID=999630 RepID=F2L2V0_THEU7|nr:hypothetical protein TUZN_0392 [Thermoproteus uzoniensis 768-20]
MRQIKLREPVSLTAVSLLILNLADGLDIGQRQPLAESYGPLITPARRQFVDSIDKIRELYGYKSREFR